MKKNNKNVYGVAGSPLGHSYSPILHNFWIRNKNINAVYKKFEVKNTDLKNIIKKIKENKIKGLNITIPYKAKIVSYLDDIRGDAKKTKSVNTVLFKNNKIIGENTDVYGVKKGFIKKIKNINNKTVFILGAGGVVPSIILALLNKGVKDIIICNRTQSKIKKINKLFKKNFKSIAWKDRNKFLSKVDVIFNATNLGMKNSPKLNINLKQIRKSVIFCEVVYNPLITLTMKNLMKRNIKTISGLDMFIYQAEKSFFIWHKKYPKLSLNNKKKIFKNLYD